MRVRLQGSVRSVRRRQATFQLGEDASAASVPTVRPPVLASAVFGAAPDPRALTTAASTSALLPSECGYPAAALAGEAEMQVSAGCRFGVVLRMMHAAARHASQRLHCNSRGHWPRRTRGTQALSACLSSRPVWAPISPTSLSAPPNSSWLPLPPALAAAVRDPRTGASPPPLGLPGSLLAMDGEPGEATLFEVRWSTYSWLPAASLATSNWAWLCGLQAGRKSVPAASRC